MNIFDYIAIDQLALLGSGIIAALSIYTYSRKKSGNKQINNSLPFDIEILLSNIGDISNIESVSSSISKVNFKLKDSSLVDLEKIKELGASGIVENSSGFTFIFGNISPQIEKIINEKL